MKNYPEHIAAGNSIGFLRDYRDDTYNHCRFIRTGLNLEKYKEITRLPEYLVVQL